MVYSRHSGKPTNAFTTSRLIQLVQNSSTENILQNKERLYEVSKRKLLPPDYWQTSHKTVRPRENYQANTHVLYSITGVNQSAEMLAIDAHFILQIAAGSRQ